MSHSGPQVEQEPDRDAAAGTRPSTPAAGDERRLRAGRRDPWRWLGPALALAFVLAPSLFWKGGVIEEEALGFLRNYWGPRTVVQRIFDPRGYDYYQGRELSYAVDFVDAQWVKAVLGRGWMYFVPPSALAASLAVVLAWGLGIRRALPRLDRATAWCLLLVYLSNFAVVSTMGLLYRSAKPLVPPLILAVLLFLIADAREPRAGPRASFAWVFVPCLTMSLLDRQGLFYTVCLTGVLAVAWLLTRRWRVAVAAGAASVGTWALYNYLLGPWIIHAANGYWPEFRFQRFRPARLLDPSPWLDGASLLRDWTSVLLGGLPLWLPAAGAVALVALHVRWRKRPAGRRDLLLAGLLVLAVVAQVAMVAVMAQRHEPVTWIDHRTWYYPLPFQALVILGLAWAFDRVALARGRAVPRALPAILALVALSNVAQWPERRLVMESGPWFGDVSRRSASLERSWRTGQADPLLDGDYRRFFFESLGLFPRLAARAGMRVEEAGGVHTAELRESRLFAWAETEAHVIADVPATGEYRLAGALWLRAGDRATLLLGSDRPRLLAEIPRTGPADGAEAFAVAVPLSAGRTDLMILSSLPGTEIRRERVRLPVGLGLLLPFSVRPVERGDEPGEPEMR